MPEPRFSGLCSITKVLLSMENDYLLPNINFKKSEFDPLIKGRMIVVTELTSWPKEKSDLAAVNNFGFGGVNVHILLKRNKKLKISNGLPEDDLPRLVCFSGRTHESIESIWNDLNNRPLDHEHIRLLNEVFSKPIMGHPYRGFSIISKKEELFRSSAYNDKIRRNLYLVLGAPNKKVICFAKSIRKFPAFNNQLQIIQSLLPTNINIFALVDDDWKNSNLDLFSATIFIQVALIELFKLLEVKFDRVIGHSTGIIATSYAQGILTLDETILTVCHIIKCMSPYNNNNVANRVHLGNHKPTTLPSDFEIISHNSGQNYTIVATKEEMQRLTENLCTKGIRLSRGNTLETFFKYKEDISSQLVQRLENVMTSSQRFVDLFFNVDDPLLNFPIDSVVVHDTNMDQLPTSIALAPNNCSNEYFLTSLGKLYELGYNPLLHVLFPKVEWPVSRGTPMISPLIKWNHSNDWFVPYHKMQKNLEKGKSFIEISSKDPNWTFVTGHIIDDRNLFPATAYLQIVWDTFSIIHDIPINDLSVTFKNIRFRRATNLLSDKSVKFLIMIQQKTGLFGVVESKELTVSGEIYKGTRAAVELPIYYEDNEKQLSKKEIYKELKLRGYNYSGLFTGIECCNLSATRGTIEWTGNWTAFMDNMLQIKILQTDIRNLYVPTYIEQVSINTDIHKKMSNKISVYVNKDVDIIKCSGVEITGLRVNAIARRKTFKKPVLETYKFIPLEGKLSLKNAITVNAQIILENNTKIKFKAVELLSNDVPIMPMLLEILQNQPLLQTDLLVVTQSELTLEDIAITDKKPENDSYLLVITSGALTKGNIMREALDAVKNNGYVLSREKVDFDLNNVELNVISFYETGDEKIVLFQKSFHQKEFTLIDISNSEGFEWLPKVQCAVKDNKQLLLLGHNQSNNGILGFINCLKQELYAQKPPMCVFLMDNKQHYDMQNPFYTEQLKKGLTINVHKDNVWGTYRHLLLEESAEVQSEHIFNNTLTRGDLSSLTWLEGPLNYTAKVPLEKTIVHINYSALNFRDIMIASGRLQPDIITTNRIEQQNLQGIEFSGMLESGKRVMGVAQTGALANIVLSEKAFMTEVPNHWTYEDAATVTAAYCTALICLEKVGAITKEKSILIHAGTGGVGLSAINIALHYGCEIFTTVGTAEKKAYLLEHFPQIPETHIGHSRDTSFELMVLKCTKGRGVDLVLNSLTEEKLQASLRCLAPRGRFLEIGKFDLQNNSNLQNDVIAHGRSFHSVMLDVFYNTIPAHKTFCMKLLKRGIAGGYVKPLPRRVFEKDDIQQAFRHMAAGKHIGKVLIKIRDENKLFYGLPRFYCNDTYTSIIIGGLGGFGLELADWLVLRGCKKLILVSRSGVKNGYQAFKISQWKKYKVVTHISTADVTTEKRLCEDAILENQTEDSFKTAFAPKVLATKHLDAVSRKMCPMIRKFVVFSSVVSGRGNAGQTNYGMANSVMERICENRKSDGYHALAIQWGAIGDVGLVADMLELRDNIEIGGTLPQKISSCLAVLDEFLNQDEVIVSSMVVADKKPTTAAVEGLVHSIMNIIGIKDLKNIGEHATLSELGMDSIMAVEINQVLERGHEIVLNPQEVWSLTFAKLKEMERKEVDSTVIYSNTIINLKAREFQPMVRLKSLVQESVAAPTLLILPGIDGNYCNFEPLAANLSCHVFCLQYDDNYTMDHTIDQIAEYLLSVYCLFLYCL
ncbi:hypothetical protein FQA39_LY17409 [Lamprigera yunnana]|nr:hypothetical protein FQA39_LY17409 [Lamprigera yunnana]